jgi:hypothetical protein
MRTIVPTNYGTIKVNLRETDNYFDSDCHYTFWGGGCHSGAQTLENKAFSRAGGAGPGDFTPNMG